MNFEWLRFALGCLCFLAGLVLFALEIYGNYRFTYVLNRMHAASIGDSLGIVLCLGGLMAFAGWSPLTLKLAIVVIFLWISTPISTHLVARMEVEQGDRFREECEVDATCRD